MDGFELFLVLTALVVFGYASYREKALDSIGTAVAIVVGIITFAFGGMPMFCAMVAFFAVAEWCTRYSRGVVGEHPEKRTTSNIIGNSGAAVIALAFGNPLAFFGAVASALSDTVSSEIGLLSPHKPRLITTFREVEHGTDGGITLLGLASAVLGAAVVAVIYYFMQDQNSTAMLVITAAGISGCLIDSLLGAALERRKLLNNTAVNFFASAGGAVVAVALGALFLAAP